MENNAKEDLKKQFEQLTEADKVKVYSLIVTLLQKEEGKSTENTLKGFIASTPQTDKTPLGRTRTNFIFATIDAEGNYQPTPCISFNEEAEALKDLKQGAEVTLEGDFHERFYREDDQMKTILEFHVRSVLF